MFLDKFKLDGKIANKTGDAKWKYLYIAYALEKVRAKLV